MVSTCPRDEHGSTDDNRRYFDASVGDPPQVLQFDVDMLSTDFYTLMTTSETGSRYNSFSNSHIPDEARVHPLCKSPTELMYLDKGDTTLSRRLMLPMCSPSKSSIYTLGSSGNVFGLAPSRTLARISVSNALEQLFQQNHLHRKLFSLTLRDGKTGNLTLGGSIAREVEEVKTRFQVRLDNMLNLLATPDYIDHEVQDRLSRSLPAALDEQFRWVELKGAEGWWTTLMGGVWINGAKVLQDQAVLLDIQSPFILAPPEATRKFYQGIHASKRLPKPNDNMFVFPCHNRPNIAFEFARWIFPTLSGDVSEEEKLAGPLGGKLSLGKLRDGSGYCVGAVVETRVGETCRNCGMKAMWIIGESFFRGTGIVLDLDGQRIGFRTY